MKGLTDLLVFDRSWSRLDLILAAIVTVATGWAGLQIIDYQLHVLGIAPHFFQDHFDAPVMLACGHGYRSVPDFSLVPGLAEFLTVTRDSFDCTAIPTDLRLAPPGNWHGFYLYLYSLVAGLWAMTEVAWSALRPLYGAVFGAAALSTFLFTRVLMGRLPALAATLAVIVSSPWLSQYPHIYYFAKVPFIVGVLALMAALVFHGPQGRRGIVLAAAIGATIGIGLGFRRDLMALLPAVMLVLVAVPTGSWRQRLGWSAAAVSACLGMLAACAWPVLKAFAAGSDGGAILVEGLSSLFTDALGIEPSFYGWGDTYNDLVMHQFINTFQWLTAGSPREIPFRTPALDAFGTKWFLSVAQHFPADLLLRGLAAAKTDLSPYNIANRVNLGKLSHVILVAALLMAAVRKPGAAMLAGLIVLFVAAYPALMFRQSEYFFMILFPVAALFAAAAMAATELHVSGIGAILPLLRRRFLGVLAVAGVGTALIGGGLWGLRAYQQQHLPDLFQRYWDAQRQPLTLLDRRTAAGLTALRYRFFPDPPPGQGLDGGSQINFVHVVAEFDRAACGLSELHPRFAYRAPGPWEDHSRSLTVRLDGPQGRTRVYFPAYAHQDSWLDELVLPAAEAPCLVAVDRLVARDHPPLLMELIMPDDWRAAPMFMRLR
jgi:hypothetical protein